MGKITDECGHMPIFEALEPRLLLDGAPANLESHLIALWQQHNPESEVLDLTSAPVETPGQTEQDATPDMLSLDAEGKVCVDVWTRVAPASVTDGLSDLGFQFFNLSDEYRLIEGSMPVTSLADAASLPGVLSITPMYRPATRLGSVTTQGDEILNADDVRLLGYDGTGVKVGVLSDSVNQKDGGLADSVATGDLPGAGNPNGYATPVEVLRDYASLDSSDEGRAMLEIVHDLAPAAELAFHTAWYGQLDFANGIHALANAGCDVIVDDVLYINEPWFQDGIIAQAINEVTGTQGVTYATAAGNENGSVHSATYRDVDGWHDFNPSAGVDTELSFTVHSAPGIAAYGILVLQWSDPWYTADGVTSDFDLYAYDQSDGSLADSETTDNIATQQPLAVMMWKTVHETKTYDIKIERIAGHGDVELKLWAFTGTMNEYNDGVSVLGHAAAEGAIAVGAVPFHSPDSIDDASSTGPVNIYYAPDGTPLPSPIVRNRPDVVAPTYVNTSFFGDDIDEDADTFPNFSGTSAAAPHVAATAALILNANSALTPGQVRNVLAGTAVDLGDPGWDGVFGAGRVDALAAVNLATTITDTIGSVATVISPSATTPRHVTFAAIQFSEAIDTATAENSGNYELRGAGDDGDFDTADDVVYTLDPDYEATRRAVTLDITGPAEALPIGLYRLTAAPAITDVAGNPLNDGANETLVFEVTQWPEPDSYMQSGGVAVNGAGRSAVIWRLTYETPTPGSNAFYAVGLAIYDENGALVAGPLNVDTLYSISNAPAVAMAPDGSVVVVTEGHWEYYSSAIQVHRFSENGVPLGEASAAMFGINQDPQVAVFTNGDFVVVWMVGVNAGTIRGRLYNADATPKGDAFEIDPGYSGMWPAVASAADGSFVVVWARSSGTANQGGSIHARRFDSGGSPMGESFQVNVSVGTYENLPLIVTKPTGEFVIAWHRDMGHLGPWNILAQSFGADGVPAGPEFTVATDADRYGAGMTMNGLGQFIVSWQSDGVAFAQRYGSDGTPTADPFQLPGTSVGMDDEGSFLISGRWYVMPLPELPDLQVPELSTSDVATIGHHIELSSTVYNHGMVTSEGFELHYYVSPDAEVTGSGNDRALLDSPAGMAEMWGGTSQSDTTGTFVPDDLTPGTYWIGAVADVAGTVTEDNETNNAGVVQIELTDPPPPLGPEFRVNTTTPGDQETPAVAATADGGSVVVWAGNGPADDQGIFLQRYSPELVAVGTEQLVNQTTANVQSSPAVASDAAGKFVVTWTSEGGSGDKDVYIRRYASDGTPLGDALRVNTTVENDQWAPEVDMADDGAFTVVWASDRGGPDDIIAQRFDGSGAAVGGEFQVNATTGKYCDEPSVAVLPDGGFLAAWTYKHFGNSDSDVRYQAFAADGTPLGERIAAEEDMPDDVYYWRPSVAVSASGEALLAWHSVGPHYGNGEIFGQWLSPETGPIGEVFVVNSYQGPHESVYGRQQLPHAAPLSDGGFVVTWVSHDAGSHGIYSTGIYGQRYAADRSKLGGEWLINEYTADKQTSPTIAGLRDDEFTVVWSSDGYLTGDGQDGSGCGVYGRVFGTPPTDLAELQAQDVTGPAVSYLGGPLDVAATVENVGGLGAGTFDAQYYLFSDPYWQPDYAIGDPVEVTGGLGAGNTWNDSRTLTIPATGIPAGTYYVGIIADSAEVIPEHVERDNMGASLVPVIVCTDPSPDLQVMSVDVVDASVARAREVTVNWTVSNLGMGSTPSSTWYDQVIFSTDEIFGNEDDAPADGGTFAHTGGLAKDASYLQIQTASVPFGFTGQIYAFVKTDVTNTIAEPALEDNNSGHDPVPVAITEPAATLPFTEGFEAGNYEAMPAWWAHDWEAGGRVRIETTNDPHGGDYHLLMDSPGYSHFNNRGFLTVDLNGQSNVVLRYWQKDFGDEGHQVMDDVFTGSSDGDGVAMSADGITWYRLESLAGTNSTNDWQEHTIDLDAEIARRGIAYDETFRLLFQQETFGPIPGRGFAFDDISLTVETGDLYGPKITGHSPEGLASNEGPLNQVTVTFDEPINFDSFTAEDVVLKDPQGFEIIPVTVTMVPESGDTEFTLSFADQNLRGAYRLAIGPDIASASGILMNQDENWINGDPGDVYKGAITSSQAVWTGGAQPHLYVEDFEGWSSAPSYWSFGTTHTGTVGAVATGAPHGGTQHLRFDPERKSGTSQSATVLVDLSGQTEETDLWLDFWARRSGKTYYGQFYVELSGDGQTWHQMLSTDPPEDYGYFRLDLDQEAAEAEIILDAGVYLRFRHLTGSSGSTAQDLFLDDLRVYTSFVRGRHIFYNNSALDGQDPAANSDDDNAIATDKTALLPGVPPGPANYTSYSRGINGVMVDIDGMPPGTPTDADFGIRVNDMNPDTWSDGPAPDVSVRPVGGGVDRVTLIWPDDAIRNQWVEVTVRATANTGLAADDVFYLANLVGDCDGNGEVGSSDYGAFVGEFGLRGSDLVADFNADGRVDLSDFAIVRGTHGNSVPIPSFPPAAPEAVVESGLGVLSVAAAATLVDPEIMDPETMDPEIMDPATAIVEALAPRDVKAAPGRRTPNNDAAAAFDLLDESLSAAGDISGAQAISIGSRATTLYRAATAEYDLRPLSDDLATDGEADDLLADILAESPLPVPL